MKSEGEYFASVLSLLADETIVLDAAVPIKGGYGSPHIDRLFLRTPFRGHRTLVAKFVPEATGREISAYEYLLRPLEGESTQPVAVVFGEDSGWWLFLRDYGEETLADTADPDRWLRAARWLATFHTAELPPVPRRLPLRERFIKYDEKLFRERLKESENRLLPYLAGVNAEESEKILRIFRSHRSQVESELGELVRTPTTQVHGDYKSRNILPGIGKGRDSVFPVDWANAGFGSPFQDLAMFIREAPSGQTESLLDTYREVWIDRRSEWPRGDDFDWRLNLFSILIHLIGVGLLALYHGQGVDPARQVDLLNNRIRYLENADHSR